jgi:hypothetical protein
MAETRKSFLLRIPPDLWEQVNRIAQSELRSVNAQIEFMLREQLRKRGPGSDAGAGAGPGAERGDAESRKKA